MDTIINGTMTDDASILRPPRWTISTANYIDTFVEMPLAVPTEVVIVQESAVFGPAATWWGVVREEAFGRPEASIEDLMVMDAAHNPLLADLWRREPDDGTSAPASR